MSVLELMPTCALDQAADTGVTEMDAIALEIVSETTFAFPFHGSHSRIAVAHSLRVVEDNGAATSRASGA